MRQADVARGWRLGRARAVLEPLLRFIERSTGTLHRGRTSVRHGSLFTNFQFSWFVTPDYAAEISLYRHVFHDADGVVEMSLGHKIGDDRDLGNTVVAAFLYHLGDADIVVLPRTPAMCNVAGTVPLPAGAEEQLFVSSISTRSFLAVTANLATFHG